MPSGDSAIPYWYHYLKDVRREDVDWDEFLMDAPRRPFDPALYSGWYGYREFSDGSIPGLASHFIDMVHFITGARFPQSCVCLGGTFTWKDEHHFTCPDQVEALWVYPEGFMAAYSTDFGNGAGSRIRFACEKGALNMEHLWTEPTYTALGGPKRDGGIRGEHKVPPVECPDHFLDWLQCLRSGKTPVAPIDAGYQHAVATIMAMRSYDSGRRTIYDPQDREIREG
jgi:predicted dehydrogenase